MQPLESREQVSQDLPSSVLQGVSLKKQESLSFSKEKLEQVAVRQWDEFVSLWIPQEKLMKKKKKKNGAWIEGQCVGDVDELGFVSGLVLGQGQGQAQEQEVCFPRWKFPRWV